MAGLRELLEAEVERGTLPGAVALVGRGSEVEVEAVGSLAFGGPPMTRDALFRIASITKPVAAAAVLALLDDGLLALDDPVARWLPELAAPVVVRTPAAPVDDVVPAARPITVEDVLSSRAGWGFPDDFSLPAVQQLLEDVQRYGRAPDQAPPADEWLARLARIPLLHQPGEAWLYNTCSDLQGALVERVSGRPLPDFLAERFFGPLRMRDTGFAVPADALDRFTSYYQPTADGGPELVSEPHDGHWTRLPAFASGAGGLVSTVDDWHAFGRMLLGGGTVDGTRVLSPESVRLLTTDHLTQAQRDDGRLFLEGQGWGYGGSVDVAEIDPWNVPGRYGWVGGTGTTAHVVPATGTVAVLMTQVAMTSPTPTPLMRAFWRYAAG